VGFVEVLPDSVSVLSQVAQRAEDLDQEKVEAGMNRAKEMLGSIAHDMDFEAARLALLRTIQQLQAESRRRAGHV
jgi:F-type H+-transporting ATPase subunit epsilon